MPIAQCEDLFFDFKSVNTNKETEKLIIPDLPWLLYNIKIVANTTNIEKQNRHHFLLKNER